MVAQKCIKANLSKAYDTYRSVNQLIKITQLI